MHAHIQIHNTLFTNAKQTDIEHKNGLICEMSQKRKLFKTKFISSIMQYVVLSISILE